jgi:luciferase family oxidoreductase group 1
MMLNRSMIPISVLDTVPISSGQDAGQALQAVTLLAQRLEQWGYHRYWLAEHHGFPGNVSSSPPVLTAHLAARTSRIRVGAGGVLLPNHPPLIVAEQFGTLEALHPGRIDLGIGRGHGATPAAAAALGRSMEQVGEDDFARRLGELLSYFRGDAAATAVPGAGLQPQFWMLGSGTASARLAGEAGLPFAFAHHFFGEKALEPALQTYRESFRPSPFLDRPHVLISVWALCAETDAQARQLALPGVVAFLNVIRGRSGPVPTVEEAATYRGSAEDHEFIDARLASHVILGSPDTVRDRVAEFVARTGTDELMAITVAYGAECRLRSFGLLSEALDISGSLPVGAR